MIFSNVDQHILNYVNNEGIDNKDHWVEENLPDLDRDLKEEVGIEFDCLELGKVLINIFFF